MTRGVAVVLLGVLVGALMIPGFAGAFERPIDSVSPKSVRLPDLKSDLQNQQRAAVRQAVLWTVRNHQNDDGGYTAFSGGANMAPSTVGGTVDAVLAIAAGGYGPAVPFPGKTGTPVDFLRTNVSAVEEYAMFDGSQAGKLILALTATGVNPREFEGFDAVAAITDQLQPDGSYNVADAFKQSLAVLALTSANETVPAKAINWIANMQAENGSWDDGFGTLDNPDATSMSMMALLAAGTAPDDPVIAAARDFLADAQLSDAGWEYGAGFGGNANSTGLVTQALSAMGEVWYDDSGPWTKDGSNPLEALLNFQSASGAFQADFGQGPFDDFFSTVQVIPAAAGRPLPLPARFEASQRALVCLDALQDPATGGWEQFVGTGPNAAGTARAIEAIRAAGDNPQSNRWTTNGGVNTVEFLEISTPEYIDGGLGGRSGVVMQGVVAAGTPYWVESFAGFDLPALIDGFLTQSGEYDSTAFGISAQGEAMLGLLVSDNVVAPSAIALLLSAQQDGNWGDPDQNGIALNVLGRLGLKLPNGAIDHVHESQFPDGGWGYFDETNPSSTSEIMQGLHQVGENPFGPSWSKVVGGRLTNGADAVMGMQAENGCWPNLFGPGDDPFSTTDALILLNTEPSWDVTTINLPVISGASD